MNRCPAPSIRRTWRLPALAAAMTAGLLVGLAGTPAGAQTSDAATPSVRPFPANALRATLVVVSPPEVRVDGQAARLSPGARIRNMQNLLVMSGALVGQQLVVNLTRDSSGLVHEVWILTDAEIAQKRAAATVTRNFLFGSEVNTTPVDDGKTPFNQLPVYGSPGAR